MGSIGPMEIVLLGLLAVLLFGAKNLPSMGRSVGRGVRDFRQSVDGTGIKDALDGIDSVRGAVSPTNSRHSSPEPPTPRVRGLGLEGGAAARRRGRCGRPRLHRRLRKTAATRPSPEPERAARRF